MHRPYQRAKTACYLGSLSMAVVSCLSPLLFLTFYESYGVSYTLLGLLAVFCFGIQLAVDLVFSFFASHFNLGLTVRLTPLIAFFGILIYAVMPVLFSESAYLWLVIGTLIFSVSAGLCEVLLSPVVAAIPAENPEREMSKLHSAYAWGVVIVVVVSTLLLHFLTRKYWYVMAALWSLLPLATFFMFAGAKLPPVAAGAERGKRGVPRGMLLCVACIFMGGASEVTMTEWCSGFLEKAIGIPKTVGDIFGLALFAVFLGLGRSLYAKYGRKIYRVLLFGMLGAFFCYLLCALSPLPVLSLFGCVFTGLCTSMLWPGTLIYMEEKYESPGVVAFALMAAGGDAGASLGPQLVGVVVDGVMLSTWAPALAERFSLSVEQLGMKIGLLSAAAFPLLGVFLLLLLGAYQARRAKREKPSL